MAGTATGAGTPDRYCLKPPVLSIIGAGRVACTLARSWLNSGLFDIGQILNRTAASSAQAATFIGAGVAIADFSALRAADIFLIGCSDDAIAHCAEKLANTGVVTSASIVFHCSGLLTADRLQVADMQTDLLASLHPARSFPDRLDHPMPLLHTGCGLEGHPVAVTMLEVASKALGGEPFMIDSNKKPLYHAAACIASNYLVTLAACADHLFQSSGLSPDAARRLTQQLQQVTLENIAQLGPDLALTGPLKRGDAGTIAAHNQALAIHFPDIDNAYKALADLTINLLSCRTPSNQQ